MAIGELCGDFPRRIKLDPVALMIVDRKRENGKSRLARKRSANHRIKPSRQEDHGFGGGHSEIPTRGAIQLIAA